MPWLDLESEIAEEFGGLVQVGRIRSDNQLRVFRRRDSRYYAERYERQTATVIGPPRVCVGCGATFRHNQRQLAHSQVTPRVCGSKRCCGAAHARLVEIDGESRTIAQWSKLTGVKAQTLQWRLRSGWPPKKAVDRVDHRRKAVS